MSDINQAYRKLSRNLVSLTVFELVARHGSLTGASDALGLSQSAVSQRIKALEEDLGLALFQREHRGVSLTGEGMRLLGAVQPAMESMRGALEDISQRQAKPQVRVALDYAFASFWLLPRLPLMRDMLEEKIDIQVLASQTPWQAGREDGDLVIQMRELSQMGAGDVLLLREEVVPVCSPGFLKRHGGIEDAQALLSAPLISLSGPLPSPWVTWQDWFAAQGLADRRSGGQTRLSNYDLIIQAAIEGQGVALGWLGLVDNLLQSGRLVRPCDGALRSGRGYVLSRLADARNPAVGRVFDWIANQVGLEPLPGG